MVSVYFNGLGTWFNKKSGELVYPPYKAEGSLFSFPPKQKISGIFLLDDEDEEIYRHTESLENIRRLLPNKISADSAFMKMVNDGIFTIEDAEYLYFKLPIKRKSSAKSTVEKRQNIISFVSFDNNENNSSNGFNETELSTIPAYLDKTNLLFKLNKELHIAIDAWKTIVEPEIGKSKDIRAKIINWLSWQYSNQILTDEQKGRIATIVNSDLNRGEKWALSVNHETALKTSHLEKHLDPVHTNHSSWLRVAIEAWMHVLNDNPEMPKIGSRKVLLEKWLQENYPNIGKETKERIAMLINPDTNGGAPKTI